MHGTRVRMHGMFFEVLGVMHGISWQGSRLCTGWMRWENEIGGEREPLPLGFRAVRVLLA